MTYRIEYDQMEGSWSVVRMYPDNYKVMATGMTKQVAEFIAKEFNQMIEEDY